MRWARSFARRGPRSANQSTPAVLTNGSSHLRWGLPVGSMLQQGSVPPAIERIVQTSATKHYRKALPATEEAGRAAIRLSPLCAHITTAVTGSDASCSGELGLRGPPLGGAAPASSPRLGVSHAS